VYIRGVYVKGFYLLFLFNST